MVYAHRTSLFNATTFQVPHSHMWLNRENRDNMCHGTASRKKENQWTERRRWQEV